MFHIKTKLISLSFKLSISCEEFATIIATIINIIIMYYYYKLHV